MADVPVRSFCVTIQWPGKEPMLLGGGKSFYVEGANPPQHVVDKVARDAVHSWISHCLPDGTPLPRIEAVMWGSLIFVPEEDWK